MRIPQARRAIAPLGAVVVLLSATAALAGSSPPPGSVSQASGKAGCYTSDGSSEAGPGTCHTIRGGGEATTLAISPDGHFAYLVGYGTSDPSVPPVLAVFRRNTTTGTLSQLPGTSGCFSRDGSSQAGPGTCTKARDLDTGDATSIVISKDGRFLYAASQLRSGSSQTEVGGIAVFARDVKTGTLRQLKGSAGCVAAITYKGCAVAREVSSVSNLQLTPDQRFLYASDFDSEPYSGIAIFRVDPKTGTLAQLKGNNGCITDDGSTVESGTIKVCRANPNFDQPWDVATPDDRFAYVGDAYGKFPLVLALERNSHGGLVPLTGTGSCVSDSGMSATGTCVTGRGLFNPERIVPSSDGRFLYVASYTAPSPIAVLNRNPSTGLLSERSGTAACISVDGTSGDGSSCRTGLALGNNYAGALSPDGRTLYFSENGQSSTTGGLVIFRVSRKTGAFKLLPGTFGCVTTDGSGAKGPSTCEVGRAIAEAYQVAFGSDGRDVYVSSYGDNGVALFYANK